MTSTIQVGGRKTALVTGCTPGGIGYELARSLNKRGVRVFATARSASALSTLSSQGIEPIELDVTSQDSVRAAHKLISEKIASASPSQRGLNYLVNNAGIGMCMPAIDSDPEEAHKIFAANTISVIRMCREFSDLLIQAGPTSTPHGTATIANISSVAAYLPYAWGVVYSGSKAALHAFCDGMRVELRPFGINVVEVVTGGVKSNIVRSPNRELPAGSQYTELQRVYSDRQMLSQQLGMDTEKYAEEVVEQLLAMDGVNAPVGRLGRMLGLGAVYQVLKTVLDAARMSWLLALVLRSGHRRQIWAGSESSSIYWFTKLFPQWFVEYYFYKRFGFERLAGVIKRQGGVTSGQKEKTG